MPRILAATDLSPCAAFAEMRAAMLCAQLQNSALGLTTVIDNTLSGSFGRLLQGGQLTAAGLQDHADGMLQDIAQRLRRNYGVACECSVETGRPAERIAARADAMSADLIAVGAHGCNSVTPNFIGNTPYKLLHVGRHSLLIVRENPEGPYRNVLVPVDFSEYSRRAAELALAIAPDAAVTLLHGFEVINEGLMHYAGVSTEFIGGYRNEARAEAIAEMERFVSGLEKGDRVISTMIQFGYAPSVIQEYSQAARPDLIVIGKHGKSLVEDVLLGSVTRHTIEETSCDILVALSANP